MIPRRIVLVTGLSGAGRSSILRVLEDLGYEAVDNPPLTLIEEMVSRGDRSVAIGIDARSRGFDAARVLSTLERLRLNQSLRPELVFAYADESALLRRYTETRRRHPLADGGRVVDGIATEAAMTAPLREAADLVIDTSDTVAARPAARGGEPLCLQLARLDGVADVVCLPPWPAAGSRPGVRCPLLAQPAL